MIGITISDDEDDSDSIICLEQKVTLILIDLDSESETNQEIMTGLQEKIEERYLNILYGFINDRIRPKMVNENPEKKQSKNS